MHDEDRKNLTMSSRRQKRQQMEASKKTRTLALQSEGTG
jgi:hypothetical protein